MMKRGVLLVVSAFLLGACALPVPVQLASWAMDGISLIATHKSVADHGLSLIANEDCAMWRVVEGNDICSGNDAGSTAVAVASADNPEETVIFETAAGPSPTDTENSSPVFVSPAFPPLDEQIYTLNHDPSEFVDAWVWITGSSPPPDMPTIIEDAVRPHMITASLDVAASDTRNHMAVDEAKITPWYPIEANTKIAGAIIKAVKPSKEAPYATVATVRQTGSGKALLPTNTVRKLPDKNTVETKSGFYFVIGSFSKRARAFSLAAKHILLRPKIAVSLMDGSEINRVVVGPFAPGDKDAVSHRVRNAGIFDAWAARINLSRWSLLNPSESSDLAQLTQ